MSANRAPEVETGVWPAHSSWNDAGEWLIAGVPVSDLVAQYGTPLYVLDEQQIRDRALRIRRAFEAESARIGAHAHVYYAGKALLTRSIARWVAEAGLKIDVASGGEYAIARSAGVAAEKLGFHGNNKSVAEIAVAVEEGVGSIVLDSAIEIERVAAAAERAGRRQAVRLRVNSGVHASTHDFLATAHEDQKFGVTIADAPRLVARIRSFDSLEFLGVHCHIGSQIFGIDGFVESARRLLKLHTELLHDGPVPELNLGGGFGIAYRDGDEPPRIEHIARAIADEVERTCRDLAIPIPDLAFEPGRWIVGNAGITLYEVGTTKSVALPDGGARRYVSVDGGMSDNARPALYGAEYTACIVNRTSSAPPTLSRVVGKHCETGDILVPESWLPDDTTPGDILAIAATGAYCYSLSSNYNALTRPALVAVREGESRLIVRRETIDDLLSRDLEPGEQRA
ncbi:MAG TPA: diaminopimelate decarboxylase [Microbacteriaceae bacterium]|nr:diaminopimelate decarboxylase [Microbacteriaceae bacterium]